VARSYSLPPGDLVYAVGDIHGRADLLEKLCVLIENDMAQRSFERATVVFLGDYVDRGFHSREVIEKLISLEIADAKIVCLAGNHEDMLVQFLDDPAEAKFWLDVGGLATLASYGVFLEDDSDFEALLEASNALAAAMPKAHRSFLGGLLEHFQLGDLLFVHAGLRPGVPLSAQRRQDKLGVRREFTESKYDFGLKIIHGHTGVRKPVNEPGRISVDTGAFATGILTSAILTADHVLFLNT
jgi:Calcineurin-like phosphoesterase